MWRDMSTLTRVIVGGAFVIAIPYMLAVGFMFSDIGRVIFIDGPDHSRQIRAEADLHILAVALQTFNQSYGFYPDSLKALTGDPNDPRLDPWYGGVLPDDVVPVDPWGNQYVYATPGADGEPFTLESYGRNGLDGGDGHDADIESWRL